MQNLVVSPTPTLDFLKSAESLASASATEIGSPDWYTLLATVFGV